MTNISSALLVLLIGIYAQANNVDLGTNTGFLFLLLLNLLNQNGNNCGCNNSGCCGNNSIFPNQF